MTALSSARSPIGFAHRGARADARENTLEAFELALELGATGLESDVWITADGVAVLDHDGVARHGLRRRKISKMMRADLPDHIPGLEDLYRQCGTGFDLSLDIKDPVAAQEVLRITKKGGVEAERRLWMCHKSIETLISWRPLSEGAHLVQSGERVPDIGPERHAAQLAAAGVEVANLRYRAWSEGMVALYQRFGLLAFGWDAQFEATLDHLLGAGIDAVYSDHVTRMVDAIARLGLESE